MVIIKSNKAVGSILGLGTHTWLEITHDGEKTTYSGSKGKDSILSVIKNYKRDYDRDADHGTLTIQPPEGINEEEWASRIIESAEKVLTEMHENYLFCGIYPHGKSKGLPRANCCTVLSRIIHQAGGVIPPGRLKGFTPGLK